ncbi:DOMON domain-containing protein [Aphelenchoides bicaudatus]|nr:DOMON domain-containing protein [Aphelenchoides bicaudatus]
MQAHLLLVASIFFVCTQSALAACNFNHGDYKLQWTVSGNTVHFTLTYRKYPQDLDTWTGIAFGEGMMQGLDAILVKNTKGKVTVTDDAVFGYGPAHSDASQDVKVESTKVKNGVLQVKFSRPIKSNDKQADLPIEGCTTWQFITSLNPYYGSHTSKHVQTPISQRVCLDKCKA